MSKISRAAAVAAWSIAFGASVASAAEVTLNGLNNNVTALISANDGAGDILNSQGLETAQYNVTYTPDSGSPLTFNTFCVDLFHNVTVGQTYDVAERDDLATAFANGSRIAMIYQTFGEGNLTSNPDQASALQIAIWDLSLSNHDPSSFVLDGDGTYSSGDESLFSVHFGANPEAANIAALANGYLSGSVGATNQGSWLDAAPAGNALDRGQSLLVPTVPEPSAVGIFIAVGAGMLGRHRGRRRR